ncbi:HesB/IscA family protein [Methylotetracoccus oryzae]|uniref:HesB/IscA family protein n=1 Tax=Methylotetracoccus oryzae TaxID=1919059 RepID=UPI00111BA502|nr:iron-sulfur cluster assembly accessory protein [Methylotetracoccus oryzae]
MDLTITPSAEKFIQRMVRFGGAGPEAGFRLSVSPGGCSGLASEFSVEPAPLAGDAVVVIQGVKLFLPAESRLLLQGVIMDFKDTPLQSGLVFTDPKATGCGTCSTSAPATPPGEVSVALSAIPVKSA